VSGFYIDSAQNNHGFLLTQGTFTTLDYPGAAFTQALGLNNKGDVVGFYMDSVGNSHGWTYNVGGTKQFAQLDDPNGIGTSLLNGINDIGQVVGFYVDADGNTDGYEATP
jgi:uncharacterized membrane protein